MMNATSRVSLRTASATIIRHLQAATNRAVCPELLTVAGIRPIREWMREGIPFPIIFDVVSSKCRVVEPATIFSWNYFEREVRAAHLADSTYVGKD